MTLQRVCVCLWVSSVLACSGGDATPLKRPSPTSEEGLVRVLHVKGIVTVKPAAGAKPFAAAVDQDLVRSDLLEPADGAFAVLGLHNGHLVRVDDVGPLKVGQILLVDVTEPATSTEAEQLTALLDPSEQNGFPVQNVADRAAAWRQMRRAGESAGRTRDTAAAPAPRGGVASLEQTADGGAGASANAMPKASRQVAPQTPAQVAAPPPPEPEKVAVPAKKSKVASPHDDARRDRSERKANTDDMLEAGQPTPTPTPTPDAQPVVVPTTEPGVIVRFGPKPDAVAPMNAPFLGGGLRACLEQSAAERHVGLDAIELRLEVKAGLVTRVRFGGALPATACSTALVGQAAAVADGWLVVTAGRAP